MFLSDLSFIGLLFQPLVGSVKEKLSQFCHVPVCFIVKSGKMPFIHIVFWFTLCLHSCRLRTYLTSMMFQIYGMSHLFLEWVTFTGTLMLTFARNILSLYCLHLVLLAAQILTSIILQNQKAHEAIIKQLNLAGWVRKLLKMIGHQCIFLPIEFVIYYAALLRVREKKL